MSVPLITPPEAALPVFTAVGATAAVAIAELAAALDFVATAAVNMLLRMFMKVTCPKSVAGRVWALRDVRGNTNASPTGQ
ncbi:MAG TPA: hypothetical protein VEA69_21890 [Tepidisphaeraceae bacterium]|nr:hypothetical protein [Tepidisphaeraceae bacterium]